MCLYKDKKFHPHNRPLVTEEDIVCYKKLNRVREDIYLTPYTDIQIPIECIQGKVPFRAEILYKFRFIWKHILGFSNWVKDGFIHSFQVNNKYRSYETFKCIIPKGTKYFIGKYGDYASEQIIFIEELK